MHATVRSASSTAASGHQIQTPGWRSPFAIPSLVSKYAFGTETATFHVCSRCGAVPLVTSEIANHLYAVVNVNVFENVEPSLLRHATATFEGEDIEARLTRRSRNWIADVRIAEAGA